MVSLIYNDQSLRVECNGANLFKRCKAQTAHSRDIAVTLLLLIVSNNVRNSVQE